MTEIIAVALQLILVIVKLVLDFSNDKKKQDAIVAQAQAKLNELAQKKEIQMREKNKQDKPSIGDMQDEMDKDATGGGK